MPRDGSATLVGHHRSQEKRPHSPFAPTTESPAEATAFLRGPWPQTGQTDTVHVRTKSHRCACLVAEVTLRVRRDPPHPTPPHALQLSPVHSGWSAARSSGT